MNLLCVGFKFVTSGYRLVSSQVRRVGEPSEGASGLASLTHWIKGAFDGLLRECSVLSVGATWQSG